MDISLVSVKPGKYRAFIEYKDSMFGETATKSIVFETPKAPPYIALAQYAPEIKKRLVKKTETVTSPVAKTVAYRERTSNKVTLTFSAAHGLKKLNKVTVSGVTGIANGTYTITEVPNSKQFCFRTAASGSISKGSAGGGTATHYVTSSREIDVTVGVKLSVPQGVQNQLMWTDTVRDVVFFLYKNSSTTGSVGISPNSEIPFKYVSSDISGGGGTSFTTTVPSYPSLTKKLLAIETKLGTGAYEFKYVIVRYENVGGTWTGYFPMLKENSFSVNTIDDIIVSASGVA